MAPLFLTADWRKLIMAQYEVSPAALQPYLPRALELDLYHGRCFVSLVGFLFDRVRVLHLPVPFHTRFEEVNLRFYVRRQSRNGRYRRGVVFLSEIVPRAAITLVARSLYGEAYSTAPMSHHWSTRGSRVAAVPQEALPQKALPQEVSYEWKHRGLWQTLAVRAGSHPRAMPAGSLEEFITQHFWGYTRTRSGGTAEYAVEHRRWQVYPMQQHRIAADFGSLYSPAFAHLTGRAPDHVLLTEGAPVRIRWGGRIA